MAIQTHRLEQTALLVGLMLLVSCVKDRNFDLLERSCNSDLSANTTYVQIKDLYVDGTVQIQEDLIIEGYVTSSDEAGNFFNTLHFQDSPTDPTEGFQIEIDVRDSHLFYPVGSRIFIKVKGLYLGRSRGVYKIGGVFTSFGNQLVGRLPTAIVDQHLYVSCEPPHTLVPLVVPIDGLQQEMTHMLVRFENMEVVDSQLGLPYALPREETQRTLTDCDDGELTLLNSGYADFQSQPLPEDNGTIIGVLLRDNNAYQLAIRNMEDIDFSGERCADVIDEFTSERVFISELADPDNNAGARFVELYNSGPEPLSLKGWTLRRYTNANTTVSSSIDLSNHMIPAGSTFLISPNASEFETVYGFAPDLGVGTNSPADSNGDDNLELVDPFGAVIDAFGRIGEDGSGTDHEFEDGRAVRNQDVTTGNPIYTFAEWTIYNDTGGSGTINSPQIAPNDFSPGERD